MPAANSRPKQRTLIRWNDDLDKSLLLFISHTCTELGIKIPYDEIGRRMGANFSEGAIVQHIAKLRAKMADLNVAPVPAPPKRGNVASKPSSVYTTKARAGPPPTPPTLTAAGRGRGRRSETARPTGVTKGRAPRRGNGRKIKRSESDIEEEEEDEGYQESYDSANLVGGQQRQSSGQVLTDRRISNAQPDLHHFNFTNYSVPSDQSAFPYASVEHNQSAYGSFQAFDIANGGYAEDEDEEVEEEDDTLPLMAMRKANQGALQFGLQPSSPGNISPKTRIPVTLPAHSASITQPVIPFSYNNFPQQQISQPRAFSSSAFSNFDYSVHDTGSNGQTPFMTPPSAFPAPVTSNMPPPAGSQASSRNDSLASQTSPYRGTAMPSTPDQERSQGDSTIFHSSLQPHQANITATSNALLNHVTTTLSEAQPANFDWDYTNFQNRSQSTSDFSYGQADFPNLMNYDENAIEALLQSSPSTNLDHMGFSISSQ